METKDLDQLKLLLEKLMEDTLEYPSYEDLLNRQHTYTLILALSNYLKWYGK